MSSRYYDMIATVDIDIDNPIIDETSFDYLLIMGPAPASGTDDLPALVAEYSNITEVQEAGYVVTGSDADPVGYAATIAFSQSPRPTSIYIAVQDTDDDGNLEAPETTIARALQTTGWYVLCTAGVDSSYYEEIALYIESQEKMFCYTEMDFFANDETPSVSGVYYRTCGIFGRETSDQEDDDIPMANQFLNVAWTAKWLNYESGSETAAFKSLNVVNPSTLTSLEINSLVDANLNYFVTVANKNISMNGQVIAGEWMDIIRFRDWLKNDMQVRIVKLFVKNPKIPYTDAGIALVQNQMLASLKEGQDIGGIAPDEYDENDDLIAGYTTSVPRASSISAEMKASRKLTDCIFKARLAGAIHFAEITGSLTYEL